MMADAISLPAWPIPAKWNVAAVCCDILLVDWRYEDYQSDPSGRVRKGKNELTVRLDKSGESFIRLEVDASTTTPELSGVCPLHEHRHAGRHAVQFGVVTRRGT